MVAGAGALVSSAELIAAARRSGREPMCPTPAYAVGAAIRGAGGRIFAGCNVENAAYPAGPVRRGQRYRRHGGGGERADRRGRGGRRRRRAVHALRRLPPAPGRVRPRRDATCIWAGRRACAETVTLGELLPMAFGPINLGADGSGAGDDAAAVIRSRAGGVAAAGRASCWARAWATSPSAIDPGLWTMTILICRAFRDRAYRAMPGGWCWAIWGACR